MCNRLGRLRMSMHACRATVRSVSWATLVIIIADWIQDANIKLKLKSTCSCPGYTPGRQTDLLSITKSLQCSKMQQQHNETHGIQLHSSANNSTVLCSNILSLQNNNSSHWHSGCRSNWWGAGEDFWKRSALEEIDVIAAVVSFVAACHVELARREFKINFQRRRRPRRHRDIHLCSNCQHMSRQLQFILILAALFPPKRQGASADKQHGKDAYVLPLFGLARSKQQWAWCSVS